jgi:hypothetical protein
VEAYIISVCYLALPYRETGRMMFPSQSCYIHEDAKIKEQMDHKNTSRKHKETFSEREIKIRNIAEDKIINKA